MLTPPSSSRRGQSSRLHRQLFPVTARLLLLVYPEGGFAHTSTPRRVMPTPPPVIVACRRIPPVCCISRRSYAHASTPFISPISCRSSQTYPYGRTDRTSAYPQTSNPLDDCFFAKMHTSSDDGPSLQPFPPYPYSYPPHIIFSFL